MADRVVLHVGCMKSGTSFVQRTLGGHREVLAAQGFCFPGVHWRQQVLAVLDVRGHRRDGEVVPESRGAWDRLRAEVEAWPGTAVVSMEFLATTTRRDIERILSSLKPARVEVVLTVRDLGRSMPSMWQEGIKNGDVGTWADYVAAVRDGDPRQPGPARRFWRHQDAARIARRWSRGVGADRFAVITLPPAGAPQELLWQRFCSVVGLDPEPFLLPGPGNESLGAASTEVLRTLNERVGEALSTTDQQRLVKRLAKRGLAPRRDRAADPPIRFTEPWIAERAETMIDDLSRLGLRVEGDLADLRPVPVSGVDPGAVPTQQRLDTTVTAIASLLRMWPTP